MRILFVTRKYPPSTGGMENMLYELHQALAVNNTVSLVKWGGSNKLLPIIYPWLFVCALWQGSVDRPDIIYLGDGIMAPLGWVLKSLLRIPTVLTIHGLDATYANPIFRATIPPFILRQTQLVTGSNEARQRIQAAIPGTNPTVIFHGLSDKFYDHRSHSEQLETIARETGIDIELLRERKLLHTNGRLVRRKGVLWFIENVLPQLSDLQPVLYLVSGAGKDIDLIKMAITKYGLEDHVRLLGRVSNQLLVALYNAADIFVMPNIAVPNDMEGFGLVALEAASCGTVVIASRLEGIQDAIVDGKNGLLVSPAEPNEYLDVLIRELRSPSLRTSAVRSYTLTHYNWAESAKKYSALMRHVLAAKS
jgi:glycosyltransferase involved in cell wall biosynthesis